MPKMSPKAYEVESVTAAAPMIEALSSTSANRGPVPCPTVCSRPCATPTASVKWPAKRVSRKAKAAVTTKGGRRDHDDDRADEGVGPLVVDPARRDPLVDDVGLLEEQLPGRDRRADDGDDQQHRGRGHPALGPGTRKPCTMGASVGMDEDHERDGEEVHRHEDEHEALPAPEAAGRRHGDQADSGDRDRDVGRYAEVAEGEAHADELGDDREEVQEEQVADREGPPELPEALVDQPGMADAGHRPEADDHLLVDDQDRDEQGQGPQQAWGRSSARPGRRWRRRRRRCRPPSR